jgi:sugar phosphate permease
VVLLLATLVQASVSMLQQAPAALGPVLADDLGIGPAQLGFLSAALLGGMAMTTLLMGILIDRRGERVVVTSGVATMALLVLIAAGANGFWWLFVLFLLASFGASSSTPGGSKAITSWFPRSRRGLAMGVRQTGIPAGGLLAALALPPLAVGLGWSATLAIGAGGTLLAALLFAAFFREPAGEGEETAPPPRVPLRSIVGNRNFLAATGYSFVMVGGQWSATVYLTLYLHEEAGVPVVAAGALLAVLQVGGIAGRLGWGAVSDRAGRRKPVMVLAGALAVPCCLALSLAGEGTPPPVLALLAGGLGVSLLGWNGLYVALVAESAPEQAAATAVAAGLTVTYLGSLAVLPIFGLLLDWSGSYQVFWGALAGWSTFGMALGWLIRESIPEGRA